MEESTYLHKLADWDQLRRQRIMSGMRDRQNKMWSHSKKDVHVSRKTMKCFRKTRTSFFREPQSNAGDLTGSFSIYRKDSFGNKRDSLRQSRLPPRAPFEST